MQLFKDKKYRGLRVQAGSKFDYSELRRKFFVSLNTILNKCKYATEIVKLDLLESHCLPILLYAIESLNLSHSMISQLNMWCNTAYRKMV